MVKLFTIAGIAIAAAVVAGCGGGGEEGQRESGQGGVTPAGQPTPTAVVSSTPDGQTEIRINMQAPTGTYQTGTATVRSLVDGKTEVLVSVRPVQPNSQPTHIHSGGCDTLMGPVVSVLQDVVNGESRTVLDKPLQEVAGAAQAINVHLSANEFKVYTACGQIPSLSSVVGGAAN
jgi:hypothetical protein